MKSENKIISSNSDESNKRFTYIKPLSQNELAQGWQLVVPKRRYRYTYVTDEYNNNVLKKNTNIYHSKINLAQLPRHLWHKRRLLHNGNSKVCDASHYYYIETSNIDTEVIELVNLLEQPYDINKKEQVISLISTLKENDVYGWPVIKATDMYLQ